MLKETGELKYRSHHTPIDKNISTGIVIVHPVIPQVTSTLLIVTFLRLEFSGFRTSFFCKAVL